MGLEGKDRYTICFLLVVTHSYDPHDRLREDGKLSSICCYFRTVFGVESIGIDLGVVGFRYSGGIGCFGVGIEWCSVVLLST